MKNFSDWLGEKHPEVLNEVSPPGWSGTVAAMLQKHPEIDNPWALSWHMKNKGAKSHYKEQPKKDSQSPKKAVKKKEKKKKKKKNESWLDDLAANFEKDMPEYIMIHTCDDCSLKKETTGKWHPRTVLCDKGSRIMKGEIVESVNEGFGNWVRSTALAGAMLASPFAGQAAQAANYGMPDNQPAATQQDQQIKQSKDVFQHNGTWYAVGYARKTDGRGIQIAETRAKKVWQEAGGGFGARLQASKAQQIDGGYKIIFQVTP